MSLQFFISPFPDKIVPSKLPKAMSAFLIICLTSLKISEPPLSGRYFSDG